MSNLIFGKNDTKNIVSVEIEDNTAKLFIEDANGVTTKVVEQYYWILSDVNYGGKFDKLAGRSHYNYICEFDNRFDYEEARKYKWKKNYDLYSIFDPKEAFLVKNGYTYFKGMTVNDVSVLSFDIETNGFKHNKNSMIFTIANAYRKNGKIEKKLFSIDNYGGNMAEMLEEWMQWVNKTDPSIILGHNIYGFDLPYLRHCIEMSGLSFDIGREGKTVAFNEKSSEFRKDGSQTYEYFNCKIFGREIVDTFFLSIKYDIGRKYDSYGLKSIIKQEGLEKADRVFIDASKIAELWQDLEQRELIKQYNLDDVDDALKLYDFMVPAFFYLSNNIPKSFQGIINSASGSQINAYMVMLYLQRGHSIPKADDVDHFQGAISLGVPGIYKNAIKWDVSSLYPSIMLEYNIYNKQKDPDELFPKFVRHFREERLKNKRLGKETGNAYYMDLDASQKIVINSAYGFLSAKGLNFNSPRDAEFITAKGRELLSQAIEWATGKNVEYWKGKCNV